LAKFDEGPRRARAFRFWQYVPPEPVIVSAASAAAARSPRPDCRHFDTTMDAMKAIIRNSRREQERSNVVFSQFVVVEPGRMSMSAIPASPAAAKPNFDLHQRSSRCVSPS